MSAAFRALPDVEVSDDQAQMELGPKELRHGVLANGLTCVFAEKRACLRGVAGTSVCTILARSNVYLRCETLRLDDD